ncbi:MAG: hypothetical protein K8R99_08995 [Actinomycetia bacterium]|nr:hypothetical protein [Actinomycetes bacterium]
MSKTLRVPLVLFSAFAIVVSSCGGDDKKSDTSADSLATDEMVVSMQTIMDLGAATPESSVDLNACPLGDFEILVAKAPAEVQALATLEDQLFTYVYQNVGEPPHLQCGRGSLGAYSGEVPAGDYHDDLVRLLDNFILTFDADKAHRGGTLVSFCAEPIGAGGGDFCEADWYDDNVWVGVFIAGDGRSSELADQWLTAVLGDVVANVVQLAPSIQTVG